mmetsp:Transcript_12951/g.29344  ORF Transcript_12951/g.29344 Transcript_12951/m.29344 type:complete len:283 (+) Transcript_12951:2193-3041(+)
MPPDLQQTEACGKESAIQGVLQVEHACILHCTARNIYQVEDGVGEQAILAHQAQSCQRHKWHHELTQDQHNEVESQLVELTTCDGVTSHSLANDIDPVRQDQGVEAQEQHCGHLLCHKALLCPDHHTTNELSRGGQSCTRCALAACHKIVKLRGDSDQEHYDYRHNDHDADVKGTPANSWTSPNVEVAPDHIGRMWRVPRLQSHRRERRSAKLEVSMVAGLPPLAFGLQHGIAECMAREDHKGMSTHRQCLHLHRLKPLPSILQCVLPSNLLPVVPPLLQSL